MQASDATPTLDLARANAGVEEIRVVHRPRRLRDDGPCWVSSALGAYSSGRRESFRRRKRKNLCAA